MASRKQYPLERLARHRDDAVQERARELGQAQSEQARATAAREAQEQALDQHDLITQSTTRDEGTRTERGDARIDDLARLHAWQVGQRLMAERLAAQVEEAKSCEAEAKTQTNAQRDHLLEAHREAQVIHKHREGFHKEQRLRELQVEEEEANEMSYTRRLKG